MPAGKAEVCKEMEQGHGMEGEGGGMGHHPAAVGNGKSTHKEVL